MDNPTFLVEMDGCKYKKLICLSNSSQVGVSREYFLLGVAVSLSLVNGLLVLLIVFV